LVLTEPARPGPPPVPRVPRAPPGGRHTASPPALPPRARPSGGAECRHDNLDRRWRVEKRGPGGLCHSLKRIVREVPAGVYADDQFLSGDFAPSVGLKTPSGYGLSRNPLSSLVAGARFGRYVSSPLAFRFKASRALR